MTAVKKAQRHVVCQVTKTKGLKPTPSSARHLHTHYSFSCISYTIFQTSSRDDYGIRRIRLRNKHSPMLGNLSCTGAAGHPSNIAPYTSSHSSSQRFRAYFSDLSFFYRLTPFRLAETMLQSLKCQIPSTEAACIQLSLSNVQSNPLSHVEPRGITR